jgi:hypothetical protein
MLDVTELVGVLGMDPVATICRDEAEACFISPNMIPTSVMPRLHVICRRKLCDAKSLEAWHPFTTRSFCTPSPRAAAGLQQLTASNLAVARSRVLQVLSEALGGDQLAGAYALLTLLSRTVSRPHKSMVVGKMALGLTNCRPGVGGGAMGASGGAGGACALVALDGGPPAARTSSTSSSSSSSSREGDGNKLVRAVCALMPMVRALYLTPETLNKGGFIPRKDYDTDFVSEGLLQVAHGCVLVYHEGNLRDGGLNGYGVEAFNALRELLMWQSLNVDFKVFMHECEMDCPIIVTSTREKLLLGKGVDVQMPLETDEDGLEWDYSTFEALLQDEGLMLECRAYLAYVRTLSWDISEEMSEMMSADWVAARAQAQKDAARGGAESKLHSDVFQLWLTLARLLSVSYGESHATRQRWDEMRQLERLRLRRLGMPLL